MSESGDVGKNIEAIFKRREIALFALCTEYATRALQNFRKEQEGDKYWNNLTFQTMDRMIAEAYTEEDALGWFLAHTVEHGVYLELANDGKHAAIKPTIDALMPEFKADIKRIFGSD